MQFKYSRGEKVQYVHHVLHVVSAIWSSNSSLTANNCNILTKSKRIYFSDGVNSHNVSVDFNVNEAQRPKHDTMCSTGWGSTFTTFTQIRTAIKERIQQQREHKNRLRTGEGVFGLKSHGSSPSTTYTWYQTYRCDSGAESHVLYRVIGCIRNVSDATRAY